MILDATITQLRQYCPPFAGRVAGAAEFRLGLQNYNENMVLPAAYVVPLGQETEPGEWGGNKNMTGGIFQIIDKTIAVIVELDARADRRGQAPAMQYDTIEAALFSAMLMWAPVACRVPNMQGYTFEGGEFLDLDRARLFYQWRFLLRYQLGPEDGWQDTTAVDLEGIEVDIFKAPPFAPLPPLAPNDQPAAIVMIPTAGQPVTPPPTVSPYVNGKEPTK